MPINSLPLKSNIMPVSLELRFPAKRVNRFAIISYFCDFFFVFCSLATNAKFFIFSRNFVFMRFTKKRENFAKKQMLKYLGKQMQNFCCSISRSFSIFSNFFERCKCRLHQKIYINLYQLFKNEDAKINSNGVSNF